jgi:predicted nucleic acid-binding protein
MSGPEFLDTDILVYSYDTSAPSKQHIARSLLAEAVIADFVTSTQVLAEFASTMIHKPRHAARPEDLITALNAFHSIRVVPTDAGIVRRAVEARSKYGIHFYDGMIVAAAERARCTRIWSEDLNPGQNYFGIAVENPFAVTRPRRSTP